MSKELTTPNPYDPPTSNDDSVVLDVSHAPNPAKTLLYFFPPACLLIIKYAPLTELRSGPSVLTLAAVVLAFVFGISAIWLGCRRYDRGTRSATMLWGHLAFLYTGLAYGATSSASEAVILWSVFLLQTAIIVVAFRNRPRVS